MPCCSSCCFYTYAELQETLDAWASEFPALLQLESIGTSYEGRDIWLCTVTNTETGPAEEKPAEQPATA